MAMYTLMHVAEMLNISYQTAWKLVKSGQIKAVKVGGRLRVPPEEAARLRGVSDVNDLPVPRRDKQRASV